MDTVYKACLLGKNNAVKEIIVFSKKENENASEHIFNSKEETFIEENKIPVRFSNFVFHKDDSIATIKNKILNELNFTASYHELYLFSNIENPHKNLQVIFENVSGKHDFIDRNNFKQLMMNLGMSMDVLHNLDVSKSQYFYEDMLKMKEELNKEEKEELKSYHKMSIGKKYRMEHNELFSANPYDVLKTTKYVHKSMNPLESFENQLLLNNNAGNFIDNTIFVCFAEDVLEYSEENSLEIGIETIISLYFPLLMKQYVVDKESLLSERENLIKKTKSIASKYVFDSYEKVDLFYDTYNHRTNELSYHSKGISMFSIIMHPDFKHLLPLDVIFKNVHSTKIIPFIKYNPGFRRENIYRFYSEEITKYGTKIPFLHAKTILKLAKETGKKKQISFSIENEDGDFYIDIETNGNINISGNNFREPMDIESLNQKIQTIANPVIHHMNDFLRKNGYEIKEFQDIRRGNVEIENMKYVISMKIKKEMDIQKYEHCLKPIFEIDNDDADGKNDIHNGLFMRFKRVENYNEMDEEDIYISSLYGKNKTNKEIAEMIANKYEITLANASVRLSQFVKNHEHMITHKQNGPNIIKVSDSPGFSVNMKIKPYDDLFICDMEMDKVTINLHIDYIDVFQMYIDSLLRMTQNNMISNICKGIKGKGKIDAKIERFDNVVTGTETNEVSDIMFSDVFQEEQDEIDDELPMENTVFGDLKQYESVNISQDVDDIQEHENSEDYEILSPLPDSKESADSKNSLMFAQEEESDDSKNSLMFAQEEESSRSSDSIKEKGGSSPSYSMTEEMDKKIDGMVLKDNNNNIFLSKLKNLEPTLFLSEDDGKFNAYSKLCQASQQRQPVILTQAEKDKIDENDKKNKSKSYNKALQYGSDPAKKNWYICPRYWCLKTNSAISEEDVKAGKCGKVIQKGEKTVPKGHYVYEFNHHIQHHGKDGSYKENTPGFLDGSLHPKGLCLPCCFKKEWDSKGQIDRRKECLKGDGDDDGTGDGDEDKEDADEMGKEDMKKYKRTKNAKQEEYVYEIRRYPIPQKRWGFLPMAVQLFLQTDNSLSVNPDNNKYLKDDESTTTLLRYGVENSSQKSFIACVADIYSYKKRLSAVPSIDEMCDIIANAVNIDLFINYHNGSLVSIFKPKTYEIDNIDPTKYENTFFIGKLNMANDKHIEFINDAIASYENFIAFLKNKESHIDHTYLWDIVCSPNPNLFQSGCNLAILKIREVDVTDDMELLCPTSVYSSVLYDIRKETIVLLKHDNYYEPIYLFNYNITTEQRNVYNKKKQENTNENIIVKKELTIKKTFLEESSVNNVKEALQIIRNSIKKYCPPQSSMPKSYRFKKGIPAEILKLILLKYAFIIKYQVINYQGKIIGFWIKAKEDGIFIPCYPSSQLPDIPVKFMDDDSLWNDYVTTRDRLKKIYSISKGEISCNPTHKIMEDGLIVGMLTETNQFIMLSNPTENIEPDGIPVINEENYIIADKEILQTKEQDILRVNAIKMISLETQFYGAFRTTVRGLINQQHNKPYKQQISEIIENPRYLYKSKLEMIERIIRKITKNVIVFKDFDKATLLSLDEITDCFSNPKEKQYCIIQTSGEYQMIIPEKHLISGLNNNQIYFSRISDELIRYKRIQIFMMDTKIFLNITNTEYKINSDEMIMLESLLTSEYFKSIEPYEHGKMTKITYETANPIISQKYSNEVSIDSQQKMIMSDNAKEEIQDAFGIECIRRVIPIIGKTMSEWKSFFPKNATEIELHSSVKCSYYPIIHIYNHVHNIQMTIEQVKTTLSNEYAKYMNNHQNKIFAILRKQGKKQLIDSIVKGRYELESVIASEVYFLTNLDLWILSTHYSLPIILFHQKKLKNLMNNVNWLKLSDPPSNAKQEYFFIRVSTEPDVPGNYLPQYNLIKPSFKKTSKEIQNLFENGKPETQMDINTYFDEIDND